MIEVKEMNADTTLQQVTNEMKVSFSAKSENEAFARLAVAAFIMPLNPTVEEVTDVKTAVSEAVTNAIIHGYENRNDERQKVEMKCRMIRDLLYVEVCDRGVGIDDVDKAMVPLFTTRPELERAGMGFAFMEAFMDELEVLSEPGIGTTIRMWKKMGTEPYIDGEE